MNAPDKIGIYSRNGPEPDKAKAELKKALDHLAKNFSKTKPYNCTIQPKPPEK